MSFGTTYDSEILHNAVIAAANAGILMVAAAGNDSEAGMMYPADYPEVISVGSTDSNGEYVSEYAGQSSAELAAPGAQIISTGILDGFSTGCGTSLSTAAVTGIASRLMEKDGANADFVRYLLKATGRAVDNSSAKLVDLGCALENYDTTLAAYTANPTAPIEYVNSSTPDSYDVGGIVTGLWMSDDHYFLCQFAKYYRNSLSGPDQIFPTEINQDYFESLLFAARVSDEYKEKFGNSLTSDFKALHGFGVYTLNLKAFWKYANFIKRGESVDYAYELVKTYIEDDMVLETNNGDSFSAKTLDSIKVIGDFIDKAIEDELKFSSYMITHEFADTKQERKYLVVGLIMHMLGDIYAHSTIVPYHIGVNTRSDFYNLSLVIGNGEYIKKEHINSNKIDSFYTDVINGNVTFDAVGGGIKKYVDITNTTYKNKKVLSNHEYVDNKDYYPIRYEYATRACKLFLVEASQSGNTPHKSSVLNIIKNYDNNYDNLICYDKYIEIQDF